MPPSFAYSFFAGLAAGALFLISAALGLPIFFVFAASLPLFYVGLSRSPWVALYAGGIAAVVIAPIGGLPASLLFLLLMGLPAWHIAHTSLRVRVSTGGIMAWFPIGAVFTTLVAYGVGAIALMTLYYAQEPGGISQMMARQVHESFVGIDSQYQEAVNILAEQWSFLIFAISIWLWALGLYAHLWLAQYLLQRQGKALRPDVAITPFIMPGWMLSLVAIAALASLIGSENLQFLGKSALMALMLPYFFLGAALMHATSKSWPNRRFFLFFVYFMILTLLWPALALSGVGLWHHIKRLSAPPPSSRS